MSRVSKHFPFIDATSGYNIPRCSCTWSGDKFVLGAYGEQLAREQALTHTGRKDFVKVSGVVAKSTYAFEVTG